jgi:succinoglycan biosynthesis transport protein ExoP
MNPAEKPPISPSEIVRILRDNVKCLILPVVLVGSVAALYAVVRTPVWEASQALIVREEATNSEQRPGKFTTSDEMKTVQETILELIRSRSVLEAALREVGPAEVGETPATPKDVARLRSDVSLSPPNGAEFGMTEVFYLKVDASDRDRAIALAGAICDQVDHRFKKLRDDKAQSMINELGKSVNLAQAELAEATTELTKIERNVGGDLAELRSLNDSASGDGALAQTATEIRNELRQISAKKKTNQQLLMLLKGADDDPGRLLATPSDLLKSQPALQRLKDGLVDAQLHTAKLRGYMSDEHPFVKVAKEGEDQVGRHLHNELGIAIRGLKADLQMNSQRAELLQGQLAKITARLERLAGLRAEYSNRLDQTKSRANLVTRAEQNLSEARAAKASADATSLISRIDSPDAGIYPTGLSRSMIVLVGIVGGLLGGVGIVFLTAQPLQSPAPSSPAPQPVPRKPIEEQFVPPLATQPVQLGSRTNGNLSLKEALQQIDLGSRV